MGRRRRSAACGPPPSSNATRAEMPPTSSRPGAPCQTTRWACGRPARPRESAPRPLQPASRPQPDRTARRPPRLPLRYGDQRHPATRSPTPLAPRQGSGRAPRQGLPDPGRTTGSSIPRRSRRSPAGGKPRRRRRQLREGICPRSPARVWAQAAACATRRSLDLGASVHTTLPAITPLPPLRGARPGGRGSLLAVVRTAVATGRRDGITCSAFRGATPTWDPRSPHLAPPHSTTSQWALDSAPSDSGSPG